MQENFLQSKKTYKLYSGAYGAGKSLIGANHVIINALQNAGAMYVCVAQTYPMLMDSVKRTLDEELYLWQMKFRKLGYKFKIVSEYNRSQKEYTLFNGTKIILRSGDDADKFKSMNIEGFWIDEGTDVDEEVFLMLQGRLRGTHSKKRYFGIITTNPDAEENWVFQKFLSPENMIEDCACFHSSTYDNSFLPETYVKNLENSFDEDYANRYLYGKWGSFKGAVYKEFNRETCVIDYKEFVERFGAPSYWIAGFDDGSRNPCALLSIAVSDGPKPSYCIADEFYETDLSPSQKATKTSMMHSRYNFYTIFCDPAALSMIIEFRNSGLPVEGANNNVMEGTKYLKGLFTEGRLFITPNCKNLLKEIVNYRYKKHYKGARASLTDAPVKLNDHACLIGPTLVTTQKGEKPIREVIPGDKVLTRCGWKNVKESFMTDESAEVFEITLSNKKKLICTGNHPIFIDGIGFVRADKLRYGFKVFSESESVRIIATRKLKRKRRVYNLRVDDCHEYFANGVLVHNCDAARYGIFSHFLGLMKTGQIVDDIISGSWTTDSSLKNISV